EPAPRRSLRYPPGSQTRKTPPKRGFPSERSTMFGLQRTDSTHSRSLFFGSAPILVAATWPSLNSIKVGMPRTPYFLGVCGFSSMLSMATVRRPEIVPAISSSAGAIILQGPHHSAQKSTSTGWPDLSTSLSKLWSVVFVVEPWVVTVAGEPIIPFLVLESA